MTEPFNLRRWRMNNSSSDCPYFYTCAGPGRSLGPDADVPDHIVSQWVNSLPGSEAVIVSLLGRKRLGTARVNTPTTHSMGRWIPPKSGRVSHLSRNGWISITGVWASWYESTQPWMISTIPPFLSRRFML